LEIRISHEHLTAFATPSFTFKPAYYCKVTNSCHSFMAATTTTTAIDSITLTNTIIASAISSFVTNTTVISITDYYISHFLITKAFLHTIMDRCSFTQTQMLY
jgi:hypothetical protein